MIIIRGPHSRQVIIEIIINSFTLLSSFLSDSSSSVNKGISDHREDKLNKAVSLHVDHTPI
jgi:hypothetical protein